MVIVAWSWGPLARGQARMPGRLAAFQPQFIFKTFHLVFVLFWDTRGLIQWSGSPMQSLSHLPACRPTLPASPGPHCGGEGAGGQDDAGSEPGAHVSGRTTQPCSQPGLLLVLPDAAVGAALHAAAAHWSPPPRARSSPRCSEELQAAGYEPSVEYITGYEYVGKVRLWSS